MPENTYGGTNLCEHNKVAFACCCCKTANKLKNDILDNIDDILIVSWVSPLTDRNKDIKEEIKSAINRLTVQYAKEQLDPAISEDAQNLIEQGKQEFQGAFEEFKKLLEEKLNAKKIKGQELPET